jgi:hypothetical protein
LRAPPGGGGSCCQDAPPSFVLTSPPGPIAHPWLAEMKLTSVVRDDADAGSVGVGDGALGVAVRVGDGVGVRVGDDVGRSAALWPVQPAATITARQAKADVFTA